MQPDTERIAATLLGRYRIERELGAGGMATVYLAEDLRHRRNVAIKVLHPDLAQSLGAERFVREIETTANLRHPHILPLYDSGAAGTILFYIMPVVEGESLRARLAREKQLPIETALSITREVADALGYAHGRGVVHRDIKPENILLENGHAVVADFGIGKALSAAGEDDITQAGATVGTPAYMSPEQAAGEPVDGRSDIYSLGCVLYEMLVGEPPFTGPNVQAVIAKRFVQTPADVMALRDGIPRPVARALQKALARTPIDRHHTAAELLAALREPDAQEPAPSPAPAQSVAVLPFDDLSASKEDEYFGDGIAEEITNALARIAGLRVAARTSAFSFKGKRADLRAIGEKLNVATVLEGSVRRAGNRVRITTQLVAVADGYHLWSERYDRELVDVFAVQDEIANAIASKLELALDDPPRGERTPATPVQAHAHELYMKARVALSRRREIPAAVTYFERAIALDPGHARAHAGLAETLRLMAIYGPSEPNEVIPRAKAEVARALELDPHLGEAVATAAVMAYSVEHDPDEAIRLWERALELDPMASEARVMYAEYGLLFTRCENERAIAEARRAARDDPQSSIVAALAAQIHAMSGHLDDARAFALRAVEIDELSTLANLTTALVLTEMGDPARASSYARRTLSFTGRDQLGLAASAHTEGARGNIRRADAYHRELLARAEFESVLNISLAMSANAAGRTDEAIVYAIRSVDAHEMLAPSLIRFKSFAGIRAHPRFPELRARLTRR